MRTRTGAMRNRLAPGAQKSRVAGMQTARDCIHLDAPPRNSPR